MLDLLWIWADKKDVLSKTDKQSFYCPEHEGAFQDPLPCSSGGHLRLAEERK